MRQIGTLIFEDITEEATEYFHKFCKKYDVIFGKNLSLEVSAYQLHENIWEVTYENQLIGSFVISHKENSKLHKLGYSHAISLIRERVAIEVAILKYFNLEGIKETAPIEFVNFVNTASTTPSFKSGSDQVFVSNNNNKSSDVPTDTALDDSW